MSTDSTARKSVLIVGASSAIARALARRLAASGFCLVLGGRDLEDLNGTAADLRVRYDVEVQAVPFDASTPQHHEAFWKNCVELCVGKLEGIVLLQGSLPSHAEAQNDPGLLHEVITVNYTSPATLLMFAANYFEQQGRGFVCAFSSVAGDRGRQSNYVYGSAKAGLTAFMEGLRQRLSKAGVTVLTVKPGFVDTAMTWGLPGMFLVARPDHVASDVFKAIGRRQGEIYTPWFWRYIMMIIRAIPAFVFNRLKL